MTEPHKAEMSFQKLSFMLLLLASIWILCYNAEQQFPARHIIDTYERLGDHKVSDESYEYAVGIARGGDDTQLHLASMLQKYGLNKNAEKEICVILAHKQGEQNWMRTIKSILSQDYSKYKVYYLNNYKSGQQIYTYMQKNSIDKEKLKIVEQSLDFDYVKFFESGNIYCSKESIVIYLYDDERLNGQNVFTTVNSVFGKNQNLKLLYTAALIQEVPNKSLVDIGSEGKQGELKYKLSKSYPYPQKIIKQGAYKNYPYIIGGLKAVRADILPQITKQSLLSSQGQPYILASEVAIGLNLLKASKSNIQYIPQPLIVKSSETQYITLNKQLRNEIKDIVNKS